MHKYGLKDFLHIYAPARARPLNSLAIQLGLERDASARCLPAASPCTQFVWIYNKSWLAGAGVPTSRDPLRPPKDMTLAFRSLTSPLI